MIAQREEYVLMAVLENPGSNWRPILKTLWKWGHKLEVDMLLHILYRLEETDYLAPTPREGGHEEKVWLVTIDGLNAINCAQRQRATVHHPAGFAVG